MKKEVTESDLQKYFMSSNRGAWLFVVAIIVASIMYIFADFYFKDAQMIEISVFMFFVASFGALFQIIFACYFDIKRDILLGRRKR